MAKTITRGLRLAALSPEEEQEEEKKLSGVARLQALKTGEKDTTAAAAGETSATPGIRDAGEKEKPSGVARLQALKNGGAGTTETTPAKAAQVSGTYREVDTERGRIRTRPAELTTPSWQADAGEMAQALKGKAFAMQIADTALDAAAAAYQAAGAKRDRAAADAEAYARSWQKYLEAYNAPDTRPAERAAAEKQLASMRPYYDKAMDSLTRAEAEYKHAESVYLTGKQQRQAREAGYQQSYDTYMRRLAIGDAKAAALEQEAEALRKRAGELYTSGKANATVLREAEAAEAAAAKERQNYAGYLYTTQGEEKAAKYLSGKEEGNRAKKEKAGFVEKALSTVGGTAANFLSGAGGSPLVMLARLMEMPEDALYAITGDQRFNQDAPGRGGRTSEALKLADPFRQSAEELKTRAGSLGSGIIDTGYAAGNMISMGGIAGAAAGAMRGAGLVTKLEGIAESSPLLTSPAARRGAKMALDVLRSPGNIGVSASAGINAYSDALANGASFGQAVSNGIMKAATEYFSNKLFSGTPFEDVAGEKGYVTKAIEAVANKLGKSGALAAFNEKTGGKVLNWLFDKAGEGLEEVISGIFDPIIDRITYDKEKEWLPKLDELTDEFVGGVLLSLLMSGGESLLTQGGNIVSDAKLADSMVQNWGIDRSDALKSATQIRRAMQAAKDAMQALQKAAEESQTLGNMEETGDGGTLSLPSRAPSPEGRQGAAEETEGGKSRTIDNRTLAQLAEKYAAEGKLSGQDARKVLEDPAAMAELVRAGLLTGSERNESDGRQKIAAAAEAYARQAAGNAQQTAKENAAPEGPAGKSKSATVVEHLKNHAKEFPETQPVAEITGNELPKEGRATDRVMAFLRTIGNKVTRDGFGEVLFSRSKVKSAMVGHGTSNAKVETIAAVPAVIQNGRQIDYIQNYEGRGYDSYIFAAPVSYKGQKTLVGVVVDKDNVTGRYYVHEVVDSDGNILMENAEPESTVDRSPERDRPVVDSSSADTVPQPRQAVNTVGLKLGGTADGQRAQEPGLKLRAEEAPANEERGTGAPHQSPGATASPEGSQAAAAGEKLTGVARLQAMKQKAAAAEAPAPKSGLTLGGADATMQKNGTEGNNGRRSEAEGQRASAEADGAALSDRDGGREPGERPGELVGKLERGSKDWGRLPQRSKAARRTDSGRSGRAVRYDAGRFGLRNAGEITVYPESEWEDDLRNIAEKVEKATGMKVVFVLDEISITEDGKPVKKVRGVMTGDYILVQCNHPTISAAKLASHEAFHAWAYNNQGKYIELANEMWYRLVNDVGRERAGQMLSDYMMRTLGISYQESNKLPTKEERKNAFYRALEEICADAYSGIDAYGHKASKYQQFVRKAARGEETSAATARRTGPPYGLKLPVPEYLERGRSTAQAGEDQRAAAERRQTDTTTTTPTNFRELGFAGADKASVAFLRNEDAWDAEEQAAAEALRDLGYEPAFFTGLLMQDGERVDGLLDGSRILIQADNRTRSIRQIAEELTGKTLDMSPDVDEEPAEKARGIAGPKKDLRERLIDLFSVRKGNRKDAGAAINEYADRALRNGGLTEAEQEELFDRLYEAGGVTAPADEVYTEARRYLRGRRIYVSDAIKAEFGDDWNSFRQRAFAQGILLTGNPADLHYDQNHMELADAFPGLFNADETDPRTMLEDMAEAAELGRGETVSPFEMEQREAGMPLDEEEYKAELREQMRAALRSLPDLTGGERYSTTNEDIRFSEGDSDDGARQTPGTEALEKLGVRLAGSKGRYHLSEQLIARDKAAKSLKKAVQKAERRLKATAAEKEFAAGLAAGVYKDVSIPKELNREKVRELADYYWAEKSMDLNMLAEVRADINEELQDEAETLLEDVNFRPVGMLELNERTPERTFRKMFGADAKRITDWLIRPVQMNEAEKVRWYNRQMERVREFRDSQGKRRELTRDESALTMLVMEGKAVAAAVASMETRGEDDGRIRSAAENIQRGENEADQAREFSLNSEERELARNYARWLDTQEQLKTADSKIIEEAAAEYAKIFDEYYAAINDFLTAHGYDPIGYVPGYAPHMQPEETQNLLEKALTKMGINEKVSKLPASIAGETAFFKPNKRWDPYFLHRNGTKAEYDIVKAYQSYVDYMADILYHTDDIMRTRSLVRHLRQTYAPEEISAELDRIKTIRNASHEERMELLRDANEAGRTTMLSPAESRKAIDEYADKLFGDLKDTTQYGNLVMWLENYANILAGKQSFADRGWEYSTGRKSLNIANRLQNAFQRSLVAGSLTSALNQTAQIPQIKTELGSRWYYAALKDILTGKTRGFANESDFLTGKQGKELLYTDNADKFISALFKPANLMDSLVSTVAVRGAFLKAVSKGKSYSEAMQYADDFGRKIMGSREKGSRPLAYESKGLFSRMIHMFQVEAVNSWDHLVSDLPYEIKEIADTQGKGKAARTLGALIVKGLLSAFVLNRLTEELYGGTPAPFDVLGLMAGFLASGKGMTTNNYLKSLIDKGLERLGADPYFGIEDESEEFDTGTAVKELGYNVMNDVPLLRNIAGVLGLGDQTLPLPGAGGEFADVYNAVKDLVENGTEGQQIENLIRASAKLGAQFVPAGRQLTKTAEGTEAAIRGGSYSKKGKLQYPIDSAWDKARAILFGKNATGAAQEHWASGENTMSEKQTALYKKLTGWGMSGTEARNTLQTLTGFEADTDENGNSINGSKKAKVVEYIDGLELSTALKDDLYFAAGYKESTLNDTPWHSGGAGGGTGRERDYAPASLSGLRLPTVERGTGTDSGLRLPTAGPKATRPSSGLQLPTA